jgi:hypothetical protein
MSQQAVNLNLHYKQGLALNSIATEILYGGAAGGGKSHLMRSAAIQWCTEIAGLQVYLFRRISSDLIKNHIEGPSGFRNLLAPWTQAGFCEIVADEIRFWNGSKIFLCHCKDEKDRFKYQGSEIHVLMIDELTHFTDKMYRFLRGRVRAVGLDSMPDKYKGKFPRIICGSNPGGVGHSWVKTAFVDLCADLKPKRMTKKEGGMLRQYIPARLNDNPSMTEQDPDYEDRLDGLGSDALVKAMKDGDWNIVEGAYFDKWSNKNIITPFKIPDYWLKFRSFDWGSAKPFSTGWWAVVGDDYIHNGQTLPRGALVRYREWYGCKIDDKGESVPDTGLKLTAPQVAEGIIDRESSGEKIDYSVADPAIFTEDGGPSIEERMGDMYFERADNKRVAAGGHVGGWDQMRDRIEGSNGVPMIYCFTTCRDSIRTIPVLQHDDRKPEDLDTSSEDHAADEWRYACMSRPWTKSKKEADKPVDRYDYDDNEDEDDWKTV